MVITQEQTAKLKKNSQAEQIISAYSRAYNRSSSPIARIPSNARPLAFKMSAISMGHLCRNIACTIDHHNSKVNNNNTIINNIKSGPRAFSFNLLHSFSASGGKFASLIIISKHVPTGTAGDRAQYHLVGRFCLSV